MKTFKVKNKKNVRHVIYNGHAEEALDSLPAVIEQLLQEEKTT